MPWALMLASCTSNAVGQQEWLGPRFAGPAEISSFQAIDAYEAVISYFKTYTWDGQEPLSEWNVIVRPLMELHFDSFMPGGLGRASWAAIPANQLVWEDNSTEWRFLSESLAMEMAGRKGAAREKPRYLYCSPIFQQYPEGGYGMFCALIEEVGGSTFLILFRENAQEDESGFSVASHQILKSWLSSYPPVDY